MYTNDYIGSDIMEPLDIPYRCNSRKYIEFLESHGIVVHTETKQIYSPASYRDGLLKRYEFYVNKYDAIFIEIAGLQSEYKSLHENRDLWRPD